MKGDYKMFNVSLIVLVNNGLSKIDYTAKDINEVKKVARKELSKMNFGKNSKHTIWCKPENSNTFISVPLGDIEYCIGREML